MNERADKIMKVAGRFIPEIWQQSIIETERFCGERSPELAQGFLTAMEKGFRQAAQAGQENMEQLRYLQFSCLHSSIFLGRYLIRIDLMGMELYLKEPFAEVYWDAGDIYRLFERDIEDIRRRAAHEIPRIRSYEVDDIRYAYAPYYHRMVKAFIREMLAGMVEGHGRIECRKEEEQVVILFGEYMGETDVLCQIEREKMNEIFQDLCG